MNTYAFVENTNLHRDEVVCADDDELDGDIARTDKVEGVRVVERDLSRNLCPKHLVSHGHSIYE